MVARPSAVALPALNEVISLLIAPAANPALVRLIMPSMAKPVAPTTCGWNGILVVVTSVSQGVAVSSAQVYTLDSLYVIVPADLLKSIISRV